MILASILEQPAQRGAQVVDLDLLPRQPEAVLVIVLMGVRVAGQIQKERGVCAVRLLLFAMDVSELSVQGPNRQVSGDLSGVNGRTLVLISPRVR